MQVLVLLLVAVVYKNNVVYVAAGMGLIVPAIVLWVRNRKESGINRKILSLVVALLVCFSLISFLLFTIVMMGNIR